MFVLEWLIVLTALAALYGAIDNLRQNTAEDPFLLLRLFTVDRAPLPSFVAILGFLIPLMAIGFGFDAVNSEHNRRTLSRILAQPIYRDALLIGKFLAGLATLTISLAALWLMVIGLGLIFLGVPPGGEEVARSLAFLVIAVFYAGVWLSLAMLLSIVFRSPATAALVALGIWLFLAVLWPMLAPALAQAIAPPDPRYAALGLETPDTVAWAQALSRLSPNHLFGEAMLAVLVADDSVARPGVPRPAAGRADGSAASARREPADRLAANRGADRRHDRAVCRRLHRVPASGSEGLSAMRKRCQAPAADFCRIMATTASIIPVMAVRR